MPVTIRPTIRSRERILAFGPAGGGKSTAALTIARRCPDVAMTVVECNDNAHERLLETDFKTLDNVTVKLTWDWADTYAKIEETCRTMGRDDWLTVDIFGDTWQTVQDWFVEQVHGDVTDYFMQVRKDIEEFNEKVKGTTTKPQKSLEALDGWLDWSVINPQYRKLLNIILRANGHVYLTAGIDKYAASDKDDAATKALFSGGYKPRGQKQISHIASTVLMLGRQGNAWQITSLKDRGRVELERQVWTDFSVEYLMKVAGWKPVTI